MFTWTVTLGLLVLSSQASFSSAKRCCANGDCYDKSAPFNSILIPLPRCPETMRPDFHLYTRANKDTPQSVDRHTVPSNFDGSKCTFFIVHGYNNDINSSWMTTVKDALLNRDDLNVILVGWGRGANLLNYFKAMANTRVVGREVAHLAENLVTNGGTSLKKMWCVGHSLGAHVCGLAGKETKFGRIVGLDPAGPQWDSLELRAGLTRDDADYVQVIHTHGQDLIPWGTMKARGHVDFYPNAGRIQPGCLTYDANPQYVAQTKRRMLNISPDSVVPYSVVSCSHSRATEYFISSVNDPCFVATYKCNDTRSMPAGCSKCHNCPVMGYSAAEVNTQDHGLFYLKTTGSAPFCMGHSYTTTL